MINLTVDTKDVLKQTSALFDTLDDALDPEEILDIAATTMFNRIRTRFREKRTPDGVKWKPSLASIIRKQGGYTWSNGQKWTGGDVLYASGRLWQSFDIRDDGEGQRAVINPVPYAVYVNGMYNKRWEFMGANEQDIQLLLNMINNRVAAALGKGATNV